MIVRVRPDAIGLDKTFDYHVPTELEPQVHVGSIVRIPLHGRRVRGWVVELGVTSTIEHLSDIAGVTGWGPPADLIELATWASWRWAGRPAHFLRTASPPRAVRSLRAGVALRTQTPGRSIQTENGLFSRPVSVVRAPPTDDSYSVCLGAARRGHALILVPAVGWAGSLADRLRRDGVTVAVYPEQWAQARAGATVVGSRSAAWAPVVDLVAAVVLDEHDEAYQEEKAPTWHAREVVLERASRVGAPVVLVSPIPSLEALRSGQLLLGDRLAERSGWPVVHVIDRRDEDVGRTGLWSEQLVDLLRHAHRPVCILNRKGRAQLLACRRCNELARCSECESAVQQPEVGRLLCHRCGAERPTVCMACGSSTLKLLRLGIGRGREDLEHLLGGEVVEVSGTTRGTAIPAARAYIGTEAALHQVHAPDLVAFVDFDQELMVPRYRASDQALALLARAARLLGGRAGGALAIQTHLPDHDVLRAATAADPAILARSERDRRRTLRQPPYSTVAEVSGEAASDFVERLGQPAGVEVGQADDTHWRLRADDEALLFDAIASVQRPAGRLRIAVDPLRG